MALKLPENFKNIVCDYWKILKAVHNKVDNSVTVFVALYKDQQSRDLNVNNYLKMDRFIFNYDITSSIVSFEDAVAKLYDGLKNGEYTNVPTRDTGEKDENNEPILEKVIKFKDAVDVLTVEQQEAKDGIK